MVRFCVTTKLLQFGSSSKQRSRPSKLKQKHLPRTRRKSSKTQCELNEIQHSRTWCDIDVINNRCLRVVRSSNPGLPGVV